MAETCINQITKEWEQKICNNLNGFNAQRNCLGSFHVLTFTDFNITLELYNLEQEELHPYKISYTSITKEHSTPAHLSINFIIIHKNC
jgi:hypothetical protein